MKAVIAPVDSCLPVVVDHVAITHYSGFNDVALYNEDGELIGRQTFNVDGDTPETCEKGRLWRHSEIRLFGANLTIAQLLEYELAGEVEHFDSTGIYQS